MEYNAPVMLAEAGENKAVQLASLRDVPMSLRPDAGAVRIPDFKELIAKMYAEIPQVPQRRVYSLPSLETQNSKLKTYTNLALLLPNPKSKIENPKSQDDFDPIYTYDLNGNRTSMIDPTGITNYTYDALNRLTSVTNNRGFTTSFTYDALGRRTSMTHGNGVVTSYGYDAASQLLSLVHQLGATNINSFSYTYDRVGNRTAKTDQNGAHNYTYDTLNRLIQATNPLPSNPLESYTYDPVGNRTNSNQNGASIFNQTNQLTEDRDFTYQYDANGNQIRKTNKTTGEITTFEYTAENQLVRVVRNGTTINYRYDGLGRRVEKEVNDGATTKATRFVFDREDILLELDGSNNIVSRYTHGQGFDEPLIMDRGGQSFFYHVDGRGSITEITDGSGAVRQRYTYSSFGKTESELDPNFIQPYRFTAREFDSETGIYFYRARYYDPSTGRFLQEDPIGIFSGPNLYAYVGNNPISYSDPFGLCRDPGGPGIRYCIETFLPQASVWGFTGDNRGPQSNGGTFRTQQFVYQTPGGSTTSSSAVGRSQFCLFGYCVGRGAERGPFWADVSDLPLGGRRIQVSGAASDGLLFGLAPSAFYNLTVTESGNCTVNAQVVGGQITPFPSIEVWQYGGPSGPQRVFYHNSLAAGTGPSDLFRTVPVSK